MRPMINFLLVLAVLWCGLHLSPAEADESADRLHAASAHSESDGEHGDNHSRPHVTHGCHTHCPVAPGADLGTTLDAPTVEQALHYAAPVDRLEPIAQAPPIEPPSA